MKIVVQMLTSAEKLEPEADTDALIYPHII